MKNKVIRGVLAAACVTTAVSAANVFGAGTEQSLVNEASAVTQEETEETSEAETTDENTPEMTETETPDSTAENAASDLPAAEVQSGKPEETAVSVQAGSYYPWVNENGIWYFKDPDGTIVKGAWREYDKNRYYLNNDGKMAVGWKKLDGAWYYFQSWGGVYRDAFYTVKNVPYYSDADGKMATGWKLIDDVYYYFDDQGAMYRNRFFEDDKNTYYVDADGKMASGFEQIDGIWYYFRSWGGMARNTFLTHKNNIYHVDTDGKMVTGWLSKENQWYYFRENGAMYRNTFFTHLNNSYYADANGVMVTGERTINGASYYFKDWGGMAKNQWLNAQKRMVSGDPQTGWYYFGSDGKMVKSYYALLKKNSSNWYYSFDENGVCILGSSQYVRAKDSVSGKYYTMEHQYYTDPSVSDRDFFAAICSAEAGVQRKTGMTAVAMVIRNRMAAQNISLRTAIYKQQQFELARNGSLTNYLTGIAEQSSSIINQLKNNGAYGAVDESQSIMDAYLKNGTKRVIPGFGDTRDDFDYLYFMTPKAFKNLNMDKEKCVTYTYTYKWTTSSGTAREDSHIFFVNWVKKQS